MKFFGKLIVQNLQKVDGLEVMLGLFQSCLHCVLEQKEMLLNFCCYNTFQLEF